MKSRHRWFVLAVSYGFILLHQADKLLIGPLTTPIIEEFGISQAQMGAVSTAAILVSALFYPVWGYLYDRYARARLLAAASFLWGATTTLNALARSYGVFLVTRGSTGIDDSAYPGIYSLLSDYFGPRLRGRIFGALQTAMPFGYMGGLLLATALGGRLGWRNVFYLTGGLGIVLAVIIFFAVREAPRGGAEPEMAGLDEVPTFRFEWPVVRRLLQSRSMGLIFLQGFFGLFPWNVLTYWFFRYLETERGYTSGEATVTMMIAIVALASGYVVGGSVGDRLFRSRLNGRVLAAGGGVIAGAVLLTVAMNVPPASRTLFVIAMAFTGVTMSMAAPNVSATARHRRAGGAPSALAMLELCGEHRRSAGPLIAGSSPIVSLRVAILAICVVTSDLRGLGPWPAWAGRHPPAPGDDARPRGGSLGSNRQCHGGASGVDRCALGVYHNPIELTACCRHGRAHGGLSFTVPRGARGGDFAPPQEDTC